MKTSPSTVVQLLGSELLDLLYVGTEHLLKDSHAKVRQCQHSFDSDLAPCDSASTKVYHNLRQISDRLNSHSRDAYDQLKGVLSTTSPGDSAIDAETRNYINGRDCKDNISDHDSNSTSSDIVDRSLKGSVDVLLIPLLRLLIKTDRFVSTSCCSGRVVLFECNPEHATMATKRSKVYGRAGRFLYSSHCHINDAEFVNVVRALNSVVKSKHDCYNKDNGDMPVLEQTDFPTKTTIDMGPNVMQCVVLLKFEPFVLHVECASLEDAAELLQICRTSGLKQSGIISCSKRVIVSICGKTTLEAPVAIRYYYKTGGNNEANEDVPDKLISVKWLVSNEYLLYLIMACNNKLSASICQMLKLYWACVRNLNVDRRMALGAIKGSGNTKCSTGKPMEFRGGKRKTMNGGSNENVKGANTLAANHPATPDNSKIAISAHSIHCRGGNMIRDDIGEMEPGVITHQHGKPTDDGLHDSTRRDQRDSQGYSNNRSLYVSVKYRPFIKPLKEFLEKRKIYDKMRKILTPPTYEVYDVQRLSNRQSDPDGGCDSDITTFNTYTKSPPTSKIVSPRKSSEEPWDSTALIAVESIQGYQAAAFIPVVDITEADLNGILSDAPTLTGKLVFIAGEALCQLSDEVTQGILSSSK